LSITTEAERNEASAVGWQMTREGVRDTGPYEIWRLEDEVSETQVMLVLVEGRRDLILHYASSIIDNYISHVLHLVAILQIPIPGYRIVKEEAQPDGTR
jgi:hypothetical protein